MRSLLRGVVAELRATRSLRTVATYTTVARKFLAFLGRRNPNRREVERFLAQSLANGARPAVQTRNQALAALRALGKHAVLKSVWRTDPTQGVPFLREAPKDPAVLAIPEVHRLFRALETVSPPALHSRDRAMLALLFTLGLRVQELVGLDVDQIDAESATLVAVRGKGGTVHDLPLEPATLALLRTWLATRDAMAKPGKPALFISHRGTRLSVRSVERLFQLLREATGTKKHVTPHTARHSAATLALMRGSDVSAVGELLRHADLNTTRRYLHLVDTRRRQVVGLLSATIPPELVPPASAEPRPATRSVDRPVENPGVQAGHDQTTAPADPAPEQLATLSLVSEPWTASAIPANDSLDDQDDLDDVACPDCASGRAANSRQA